MYSHNFIKGARTSVARGNPLAKTPKETGITLSFRLYGMKTLKTEEALWILAEIGFDSVEFTV